MNHDTQPPVHLTDAGLETVLIFEHGFDLPCFAAFPIVDHEHGRRVLDDYYDGFIDIAEAHGVDLVLDTPTWRASQSWGDLLGYDAESLARLNVAAVELLDALRARRDSTSRVSISGCVGSRDDGYRADERMSAEAATDYHRTQIGVLADAGVDLVTALTMTYADEAIGVALAAREHGVPAAVSFTVETDGRLPSGETLAEAIDAVDAASGGYPTYFGINCAHPEHFAARLDAQEPWIERVGLVRANASRMSHEELDDAPELDAGDPVELGGQFADLRGRLPRLEVMGGCCGTNHVHIAEIARACTGAGSSPDTSVVGSRA